MLLWFPFQGTWTRLILCTAKDFYKLAPWAEAPRAKDFCKKLDNHGGLPPPVDEAELHRFMECGLGSKIHFFVDCRPFVKHILGKEDFDHVGKNPSQLSHLLSLDNAHSRLVEVARHYKEEAAQDSGSSATSVNMALYCKRGEQRSVAFGVLLQRLVREACLLPASLDLYQPVWGGCQGKCEQCTDGLALTLATK